MNRAVSAGGLVREQIDIYNPAGGFNRQAGTTPTGIAFLLFVDNAFVGWPLADGSTVADSSVSAGTVYFNEIPGSAGFYNVRFLPDRIGMWRLIFRVLITNVEIIKEFDVVAPRTVQTGGLNASFVK